MRCFLLIAQLAVSPQDTATYSSDALRALVSQAAQMNRAVPGALGRYRARVESEISMGPRSGSGKEMAISLEQVAANVTWTRSGDFEQHVVGYRTPLIGLAALVGFFRTSWYVPSLYGNRISLLWGGPDTARAAVARRDTSRPPLRAVHPLALDRDRYYRFTGGDTVQVMEFNGRAIRIARVDVHPRDSLPPRSVVFEGEIDLDVARRHLVRIRGAFYRTGGPVVRNAGLPIAMRKRPDSGPFDLFEALAFVEVVNAEIEGEFWIPQYQRWELQVAGPILGSAKQIYRIVSRTFDFVVTPPDSAQLATLPDTQVAHFHPITMAPRDSLGSYADWHERIGVATSAVDANDFIDVGPRRWRPSGSPIATVQADRASDLLRFNRVEGFFTGIGANVRFRDAAPGLRLSAAAGYAWSEEATRGRVRAEYQRRAWTIAAHWSRSLDITNDFRNPADSGSSLGAMFGVDEYDYVDRYSAGVQITRTFGRRAALIRIEGGWARDEQALNHRNYGVFGDERFIPNRGIDPGSYARTAATIEWHPSALIGSAWPGIGASVSYLRGDGDLDFQRIEARVRARTFLQSWEFGALVNAGMLTGSRPPQQLFEADGEHYYKEFAGDRAATTRASATYRFGFLRAPIVRREKSGLIPQLVIPGIAPMITVAVRSTWTGASNNAALASIARLGPRASYEPGTPVLFTLAPNVTGHPRTFVTAGVLFFNGVVGISTSRAVDHHAPWRWKFGFDAGRLF